MKNVYTSQFLLYMLEFGAGSIPGQQFGLFNNNPTLSGASTMGDLVECDYEGYVQNSPSWDLPGIDPSGNVLYVSPLMQYIPTGSSPTDVGTGCYLAGNFLFGNTATGTVSLDVTNTMVDSVTITDGGTFYERPPHVTFSPPLTGDNVATGVAIITDGQVSGVSITNPGGPYAATYVPTATFDGPQQLCVAAILDEPFSFENPQTILNLVFQIGINLAS